MSTNASAKGKREEQAPQILQLPIGTGATIRRKESDSLGDIEVPADHYWGLRPNAL